MQILTLELENAKSYERARVEFTSGMNAIVGHNGAGKSTIVEAIGFTLFDSLNYRHRDFVREGAKSASVTTSVLSGFDERVYEIVRRCGSTNQYFVYDPELDGKLVEGKADVLQFLRQHMEVRAGTDLTKLFSDAVGVPQGTFTAAFHLSRTQRKSIFDPLLQVEEYRTAYERLREPLGLVRERRQELDVRIAGLSGQLDRLSQLRSAVAQRSKEIQADQSALAEAEMRLKEVALVRTRLEKARVAVTDLEKQTVAMDAHLEGQRKQLATSQMRLERADAALAIVVANREGYQRFLAAQKRQADLEVRSAEKQALVDRQRDLSNALALVGVELEGIAGDLKAVDEADAAVAKLTPIVERQEALERKWQTTREAHTQASVLNKQIERRQAEAAQLETRLQDLHDKRGTARELEEELRLSEATLATLQDDNEQLRQERSHLQAEAASLEKQQSALAAIETATCPICENPLTPEHRAELLARNENKAAGLATRIGELQQAVADATNRTADARSAIQALNGRLRALPRPDDISQIEDNLTGKRLALEEDLEQLNHLQQSAAGAEALQAQLEALGRPRDDLIIAREMASRRKEFEDKRGHLRQRMAAEQDKFSSTAKALEEFASLDDALSSVRAEIAASSEAHQAVLANQKMASEREALADEIEIMSQAVTRTGSELEDLRTRLDNARKAFDEDEYKGVLRQEQGLRADHSGLQSRLRIQLSLQEQEGAEIERLEAVAASVNELKSERFRLNHQSSLLEDMRKLLNRAGPFVTRALIGQISEDAAAIFGDIMQDYSRHLTWHEDYEISLDVEGRQRQFGQLSGGEQMSAALAVRLALLHEMSNIDIAFFDEPTTNLDETRRESLARQILRVKGLNQLFVISHDDTFEQATETLIRVERINGLSQINP